MKISLSENNKLHYEDSVIVVQHEVPAFLRKFGEIVYGSEGGDICQIPLEHVINRQIDFADMESWKAVALCLAEVLCKKDAEARDSEQ